MEIWFRLVSDFGHSNRQQQALWTAPGVLDILMDEINFAPETMLVGICRGIIRDQGFLGDAKWISQPSTVIKSLEAAQGYLDGLGGIAK